MNIRLEFTIAIDVRTAIGCGQLFLAQKQDPASYSPETVVGSALDSLITWLEKQNQIPALPPTEDPQVIYNKFFKIVETAAPHPGIDFGALGGELERTLGETQVLGDPTEVDIDDFKRNKDIMAAVDQQFTERDLQQTKRTTEPAETVEIVEPLVDLEKTNRMSLQNLAKMAPKDVLIEKCTKGIVDKIYIMAVEVVYTSLPLDLWGTKVAEEAVMDLVSKHDGRK